MFFVVSQNSLSSDKAPFGNGRLNYKIDALDRRATCVGDNSSMISPDLAFFHMGQVFGLFNFLVYAAGDYFLFVEWKRSGTN
uniref:Uncharacterized protein n=1 Tax=Timema genevievae TaxID=629358 RepID=A0A7R9K6D2_TIMGE|nr:unnamed protein product [Timema genevievae]